MALQQAGKAPSQGHLQVPCPLPHQPGHGQLTCGTAPQQHSPMTPGGEALPVPGSQHGLRGSELTGG